MNKRQKKKKQKQLEQKLEIKKQQEKDKPEESAEISQDKVKTEQIKCDEKDALPSDKAETVLIEEPEVIITSNIKKQARNVNSKLTKLMSFVWLPVSFLFLELVMGFSTDGNLLSHYGLYILVFSLGYGLILYFLTNITKWKRVNAVLQGTVLFFVSFFYLMIYLLFCEFRVFYDLNTMLAGADDAIGDFTGDIVAIVATPSGAFHVFLFFLPFILYLLIGRKYLLEAEMTFKGKSILFGAGCLLLFLNIFIIQLVQVDSDAYGKEYHYDTAISDFGVLTGLRLEVKNAIFGGTNEESLDVVQLEDEDFEVTEAVTETVNNREEANGESITEETTTESIPIGNNEIDIDFDALAQQDLGTYAELDEYVKSLKPSEKNQYTGLFKGKNLIFITAEAFTAEVIDEELTPTLYRLANKGIQFTDYYQPSGAGTTGGEYSNIFGMLPTAGGSSVKNTASNLNWTTIGSRLDEEGYYGKVYHNNDYKYYDRHLTHVNLGYSDGYEGMGNGLENVVNSGWPESDLEMMEGTFSTYKNKQPFNIYYMTVSGHSLYSKGKNAMTQKHWEEVEDLEYSDAVKSYIACQLELEAALSYLVEQLEKNDMADDTVIVIAADHFPYGLSFNALAELYGESVDNDFIRDHNRLIMWCGCLEDEEPIVVDTPTTSMDILPTLCNLFEVRYDSRLLPGRDVFSDALPLAFTLGYDWKTDKGTYFASKGKFIPVNESEEVSDEYIETVRTIVKNKINYSRKVLQTDYFRHLFGEEEDE